MNNSEPRLRSSKAFSRKRVYEYTIIGQNRCISEIPHAIKDLYDGWVVKLGFADKPLRADPSGLGDCPPKEEIRFPAPAHYCDSGELKLRDVGDSRLL